MNKLIAITLIAAFAVSCGTIFKGSSAEVRLNSSPSNATVSINGVNRGVTPVTLSLQRNNNYIVTFKKEGYEDVNAEINKKFDGATTIVGNLFSWGLLGLIVDVASGAAYSLSPADVQANLEEMRLAGLIDEEKIEANTIHVVMLTKEQWDEIRSK